MLRFRSGRSRVASGLLVFSLVFCATELSFGGDGKHTKHKNQETSADASGSPSSEAGLTNIPLPIGHEAKGLVLPDFDPAGHLRGRFEAEVAKRVDDQHMSLSGLKMSTFTDENALDLRVEMKTSLLDLKSRVLSSKERATVTRTDFTIVGDSLQFDTVARSGTMVGNVKMVITNMSQYTGKEGEKDAE